MIWRPPRSVWTLRDNSPSHRLLGFYLESESTQTEYWGNLEYSKKKKTAVSEQCTVDLVNSKLKQISCTYILKLGNSGVILCFYEGRQLQKCQFLLRKGLIPPTMVWTGDHWNVFSMIPSEGHHWVIVISISIRLIMVSAVLHTFTSSCLIT